MFPDLENPFMALLFGSQVSNQMVLHSLLGSATIGTFIAVIVTVRVYPPLVGRLFNVDREKVENKCKLSFLFVLSVSFLSANATASLSISLLDTSWVVVDADHNGNHTCGIGCY
jgi:membrane-bound acyltransferase YfiQ involved in biofilm formation